MRTWCKWVIRNVSRNTLLLSVRSQTLVAARHTLRIKNYCKWSGNLWQSSTAYRIYFLKIPWIIHKNPLFLEAPWFEPWVHLSKTDFLSIVVEIIRQSAFPDFLVCQFPEFPNMSISQCPFLYRQYSMKSYLFFPWLFVRVPFNSNVSVVEVPECLLQLSQLGILASIFQCAPLREAAVSVLQESLWYLFPIQSARKQQVSSCWIEV